MHVSLRIVHGPQSEPEKRTIDISRIPVLGEYVVDGNDWFEIKRVVHVAHGKPSADEQQAAEVFAVPVVDPTDEPLTLSEWLEPAP